MRASASDLKNLSAWCRIADLIADPGPRAAAPSLLGPRVASQIDGHNLTPHDATHAAAAAQVRSKRIEIWAWALTSAGNDRSCATTRRRMRRSRPSPCRRSGPARRPSAARAPARARDGTGARPLAVGALLHDVAGRDRPQGVDGTNLPPRAGKRFPGPCGLAAHTAYPQLTQSTTLVP